MTNKLDEALSENPRMIDSIIKSYIGGIYNIEDLKTFTVELIFI